MLQWFSFGSLALMPEITKNCTRLLSWIKGEQKNWDSTPLMVWLEIGTIYFARSTWISVIYYYAKCHRIILRLSHLLTLMGVDHVRKTICMKFQFLQFVHFLILLHYNACRYRPLRLWMVFRNLLVTFVSVPWVRVTLVRVRVCVSGLFVKLTSPGLMSWGK